MSFLVTREEYDEWTGSAYHNIETDLLRPIRPVSHHQMIALSRVIGIPYSERMEAHGCVYVEVKALGPKGCRNQLKIKN